MAPELYCYNCGHSLAALTPPLSRRDLCPGCSRHLHVCRMCVNFDPTVIGQCREEDAEEVLDKQKVNFCDWFEPSASAWNGRGNPADAAARADLAALFDDDAADVDTSRDDDPMADAEKLFK